MKIRRIHSSLLVLALAFMAGHTSHAEDVPRTADGKPDFSGMYTQPATVNATGPRGNLIFNADKMAPVKPGAESLLYHARTGDARVDEPRAMCLPSGFPSGMLYKIYKCSRSIFAMNFGSGIVTGNRTLVRVWPRVHLLRRDDCLECCSFNCPPA
jgi:hypothetical protein